MNTGDRELLELAAKAIGMDILPIHCKLGDEEWTTFRPANGVGVWNPLEDDGDALRLAVKLGLKISIASVIAIATHHREAWHKALHEDLGDDPYAATRRAIVRAAAEIGRSMP